MAPLALQVVINWRPGPSAFTLVTSNGYDLIHLSAPVVPLDLWVSPGCRWEAGETDSVLKLPAFSRCIERRQPPFRPAGIQRCSKQTLRLWRSFHFSYPPFTLALRYLLAGGRLVRPCSAREPEVLVGSLPEHTAAVKCHASMSKHGAEVVHCSSRGISFHAGFVVSLLGTLWTAAWPSFKYVMASTLAFIFHQDLTQFMLLLFLQRSCLHCVRAVSEAPEYSKLSGP